MKIPEKANKLIGKLVNTVTSSVSQTKVKKGSAFLPPTDEMISCCRNASAESIVLLKNDNSVLPVKENEIVSLFGRVQYDTFFVGYGSGGDVNAHYTVNINSGIKKNGKIQINEELDSIYRRWIKNNPVDNGYWGHWPMCYEEMPVSDAIAKKASLVSDKAIVFIGRAAGEDRENTLTKGSYYLSDAEEKMLYAVSRYFKAWSVVLNIGGIFDFSWINKYSVPSVLICWHGGMETGNAVADVLSGAVSPSGCLTDTIPSDYESFPSSANFGNKSKNLYEEDIFVGYRYFETFDKDSVMYPFGYGLSYSSFEIVGTELTETENDILISANIRNTGNFPSKKVIQVYSQASTVLIDIPSSVLIGFCKTNEILPGTTESVNIICPKERLKVYDEIGKTGYKSAFVIPKGIYGIHTGFDIRNTVRTGSVEFSETLLIEQLEERCAPLSDERLMRYKIINNNGHLTKSYEPAPTKTLSLRDCIKNNLPGMIMNSKPDCTFYDVIDGKASLEEFTGSLSCRELEALSRGDYSMNSPLGPKGNAGVFAGVLPSLREKGVPPVTCTDGPSGIRLAACSSLLPNGTALASSWNPQLTEKLYTCISEEMQDRNSDVLLAPGMNIHRNPLCGRNFEYFSEDPMLTGIFASAVVKGLQKNGISACPKHLACNNQETNRIHNSSVVSERALREIYLRGFEICVKEAKPQNIMTSYNKINGVWSHYNYELVTGILRNEWKYEGNVITDWWMRSAKSPEFPKLTNQAYRVRSGVNVLMPGGNRTGKKKPDGTLMKTLGEYDGITLGELQQNALNVLRFALYKEKEKKI